MFSKMLKELLQCSGIVFGFAHEGEEEATKFELYRIVEQMARATITKDKQPSVSFNEAGHGAVFAVMVPLQFREVLSEAFLSI